jgi:hypothetical protein
MCSAHEPRQHPDLVPELREVQSPSLQPISCSEPRRGSQAYADSKSFMCPGRLAKIRGSFFDRITSRYG